MSEATRDQYSTEARKLPREITLTYDRLLYSESGLVHMKMIGATVLKLAAGFNSAKPSLHIPDVNELRQLGMLDLYAQEGSAIRTDVRDLSSLAPAAVESILQLCDQTIGDHEVPISIELKHIAEEDMRDEESTVIHDTHDQVVAALTFRYGDIWPTEFGTLDDADD